ncbi:hypothetical protein K227x_56990 [Rubripirellula lacrimiformis]|uniref:Uncharacterized protein n=1 Tax=Rubripirellula lacrimiformis TaxID=1930273 RepID=A0A517NJG0_9BACT|nr:hypothetical protein K227x_56990 [Rubripirellula lacrimiformis]
MTAADTLLRCFVNQLLALGRLAISCPARNAMNQVVLHSRNLRAMLLYEKLSVLAGRVISQGWQRCGFAEMNLNRLQNKPQTISSCPGVV